MQALCLKRDSSFFLLWEWKSSWENDDWVMESYILTSDAMKVCYVEEKGCFETDTEN